MKLQSPHFRIALIEPEIPNNTGSIGRTCVGTQCQLHLVGRLGFDISDKAVRRAGLDYWENLDLTHHPTFEAWEAYAQSVTPDPRKFFYFSKKASRSFWEVSFQKGDWLIFGKETAGLDAALLRRVADQTVRIPQFGPIRSLNLSNAVSVAIYEGLRQLAD